MNRTIREIIRAERVNMGGIEIDQALPTAQVEQVDPFLLIHHWKDVFPGGESQENIGVGPHPHRGFAPVTLVFDGAVHHRDSEGFDSIVESGGTQWMNSGKGIIHSERPSKRIAEEGGSYEIIQFWVNAPSKNKLDAPKYQALHKEDTPSWLSKDGGVRISLVAGSLNGHMSPIESYSPLHVLTLAFNKQSQCSINLPKSANTLLYVLDGQLHVSEQSIGPKTMAIFDNDHELIELTSSQTSKAIILSGEPINEPLATYGPFVMNNSKELMNAIQDYQKGKMGSLVEEFH